MGYRVRLDMFEGPLDLLLYLIHLNQIDIYDIPIARITEEYLQCLATMHELDLDVAGEFLVLAATLIHIKSRMLLPPDEPVEADEPPEDPRRELVDRLLEYKRFKEAALTLETLEARQQLLYTRPIDASLTADSGSLDVNLSDLLRAFSAVMRRAPATTTVEITQDTINVGERMVALLDRLMAQSPMQFTEMFDGALTRAVLIGTFLGLLELLRQGLVLARQSGLNGDITIYRNTEVAERRNGRPA